jgi:hypothetical protein
MLFAVWGEAFIDKFAGLTMASLLSPGNLPALSRTHRVRLMFYTDRESEPYLWDRMTPLTAHADMTVATFEDTVVDGRNVADGVASLRGPAVKHELERLVTFHALDTILDHGEGSTLFVVPSDLAASDGSFAHAQAALDGGAEAVAPPVLRLVEDRCGFTAAQLRSGVDGAAICLGLPDAFQHITRSCIATSESFSEYPASVLWPVGEEGFVCRTFFPLTLAFKPRLACRRYDSSIDYDFLLNLVPDPARIHISASSAEICAMKVSSGTYMQQEQQANRLRPAGLAHFMLTETNKAHRNLFARSYSLLKKPLPGISESEWTRVESESGAFVDDAYRLIDQIVDKLPPDTPGLAQSVTSHFGGLDDYLSPMRRQAAGAVR